MAAAVGAEVDLADQVIEGTPGTSFSGRLTLTVTAQDYAAAASTSTTYTWTGSEGIAEVSR